MGVSGQASSAKPLSPKGPRARMQKIMHETAMRLMQSGIVPSVSDVAEAADVSRATAYRYFPSQAAMMQAAVDEALGPILTWTSEGKDVQTRVGGLFDFGYPRMQEFEVTHRAALLLALEQWSRRQAGTMADEPRVVRGNRRGLLRAAVSPLKGEMSNASMERLAQALSLIFGIESIVVLKDIWGLDSKQTTSVASWAARALVRAALLENDEAREAKAKRTAGRARSRDEASRDTRARADGDGG
jgi:AcrR family transcriptional regulator